MSNPFDQFDNPFDAFDDEATRTRRSAGYRKARTRLESEAKFEQGARQKFGGGLPGSDLVGQIARNSGAMDEVAGGMRYLAQGAENVGRRVFGKPIETTATEAGRAAMDYDREQRTAFAKAHPSQNFAANALLIPLSGRPTGGAPITNPLAAGAATAVQNLPFAVARQQGTLRERAPGAAVETGIAFGAGAAFQAGSNALASRAARVRTAPPSPQRQLANAGVQLTPGQIAGGLPKRFEDAATSIPLTGGAIQNARRRGIEDFNRAGYNRASAPLGQTVGAADGVGREGVAATRKAISDAYTKALDGVTIVPDQTFGQELNAAVMRTNLPPNVKSELDAVLNNTIAPRFGGAIDGATWKAIDAELGAAARSAENASATQPSQRFLANALGDVRKAFQGTLQRTDPGRFAAYKAADEAFANFTRIRQAAQTIGAEEGVFTPAQLHRAVQAGDASSGNINFATGNALMQDLTDAGVRVMPSKVPDSGTPLRIAAAGGLYGGISSTAGLMPAAIAATADAIGAMAYSPPVIRAVNAAYRASSPGQATAALSALQSLAARITALVPLYEQLARQLGAPLPRGGDQRTTQQSQQGY